MTDPQLPPPSGAVPPVPPAPPASPAQEIPAAPPAYPVTPPTAPAHPAAAPAFPPAPPTYPQAPTYPQSPAYPSPSYPAAAPAAPPAVPAPQAPPGAYQVPVGGYALPQGGYAAPQAPRPASGGFLGILALILGGLAAIVIPIIAGIAGFEIGVRIPSGIDTNDPDFFETLSPARVQVLWAEIAFWAGTLIGIAAIVVGILSITRKQRRALGIIGLILAILGAGIYWIVLITTISVGATAGFIGS